ncbi:MAG: NADH-quinone oxidoreductase subunit L, partial [Actinobacteria bacterium]|nr:NADH-quinone oxidoreductase subunit L [Actinomycetota bacterium]
FLIGFWFQDEANASAGKKAFITNRVGDWGFLVAMFFAFAAFGTLNYTQMFSHTSPVAATTMSAIVLFLFLGAVGKSAQLPLYLWLPDAMAGPTPVSALMHAATMVTAGVYLMVRVNPFIAAADPWVGTTIAFVGGITALFAATAAIAQTDIKKVLAYSTVSQLGYMVMAVGSGAYVAGIFHMVTHAFFKALLFLGAGAVIKGMNNEQDMNWYGKLWKFFPITGITFVIAWLAIAGVPPFAGFWSKGDILGMAWHKSHVLWAIGAFTALLTAYYMTREVVLTFFGERRWTELADGGADADANGGHGHDDHPTVDANGNPLPVGPGAPHHVEHGAPVRPTEAPWIMTIPLVVLAVGAVVLGAINLPFGSADYLARWLEPSVHVGESTWHIPSGLEWGLEGVTVLLTLVGLGLGFVVYQRVRSREAQLRYEPKVLANVWYYDIAVSAFMGGPVRRVSEWLGTTFERVVLDGAVNGVARLVTVGANETRRLQTGKVRNYALGLTAGAALLLLFVLYRASF